MTAESQNFQNKKIRSFGRIKSRRLSDHKKFLLENLFPKYEISENEILNKNNFKKVSFEIGFGFGDFSYEKAKNTPDQLFLGSEPHINGVVNVLAKISEHPISNLKISKDDARELLNKFSDNYFDEIYILFPDPWPKLKHFKRRLINQEFLDEVIAKKLKPNAKLIIATDHDSYKTWILCEVAKSKKLIWDASSKQDWQTFPTDWIETKYQKKAAKEGRTSVIFNLTKI